MCKEKINIAVMGCAHIAKRSVLPAIKRVELFNLVGIASRSQSKADNFASFFETQAYYDYNELLNIQSLDAVYIPLPNALQYEWVKKALNKGLNVLVEKSMCCTYEQVLELNESAREKNLVLIENFQFRFHEQLSVIKELLNKGEIGELRNMRSSFGFPPFQDQNNFRYNENLGGGSLYDAGAYPIKLSQIILGNDLYIESASLSMDEKRNIDIYGSAYLKQKSSEITSQIAFGFDNFYQCNIELWGSKGRLYTNRIFTAPSNHEVKIEIETSLGKRKITVLKDNHFENMLRHFHCLLLNKKYLIEEYEQNINQARLINELKEKADGK